MKKIKIITLLVCAVIFVFGININCDSIIENSSTYAKLQIKKTTGVKMPKEANMLYQYNVKYFQTELFDITFLSFHPNLPNGYVIMSFQI